MEYRVKIKKTGFRETERLFKSAQDRMKDLSVPLKQGGLVMLRSIEQNFKAGGLPNRWKSLKPATVRFKSSRGYSPLPLTRSGAMQRSVTFLVRDKKKLAIGTSIPYGAVHQKGGGNNIPKRPFLIFKNDDLKNIKKLVVGYITGKAVF